MATVNIYDMADTWNSGGTTFTAIKMNVTDTASAAASRLLDLLVGGSTRFAVAKDGYAYAKGIVGIGGSAGVFNGFALQSTNIQVYTNAGTMANSFHTDGLHTASNAYVGFSSSSDPTSGYDTIFSRDAAGVVGVRGSTTTTPAAMSFYTYGASPPSAPSASIARIYADTLGGKIRLVAVFPSGAAQQIAIEP